MPSLRLRSSMTLVTPTTFSTVMMPQVVLTRTWETPPPTVAASAPSASLAALAALAASSSPACSAASGVMSTAAGGGASASTPASVGVLAASSALWGKKAHLKEGKGVDIPVKYRFRVVYMRARWFRPPCHWRLAFSCSKSSHSRSACSACAARAHWHMASSRRARSRGCRASRASTIRRRHPPSFQSPSITTSTPSSAGYKYQVPIRTARSAWRIQPILSLRSRSLSSRIIAFGCGYLRRC
mmetsp:Transcript_66870/g.211619  ORF Transcript_66870/g.211619 Transcript_66870/m.211619 type:complete len:242 (-) Transcript_66870:695-1420(-)